MKKRFGTLLALCAVLGFAVSSSEARPRGGGRGAARGGARPGNFSRGTNFGGGPNLNGPAKLGGGQLAKPPGGKLGSGQFGQKLSSSNLNSRVGAAQNKFSQLQANFTSKNEPFSPAWYADHPGAWQYTHPHADAWAVATLGAASAWLGLAALGYPADDGVSEVYTADTGVAQQDEQLADQAVAGEDKTAAALAAEGAVDLPKDTKFLSLGVYALAPAEQNQASSLVQLSVTPDGILRGSYVDLLSDQEQTIVGVVDKASGRAAWKLGEHGNVVFETSLETLTQSEGPVELQFANGSARQYTLARYENRTGKNE